MELTELGRKIFLDRYSLKDMDRSTVTTGDEVIVVDRSTGQRTMGVIRSVSDGRRSVTVQVDEGFVEVSIMDIDKPIETDYGQVIERVSRAVAAVEDMEVRDQWRRTFADIMQDFKFIPGGRILAAAGNPAELSFFNCFVLPSPKDSREGIFRSVQTMAEIMARGGGVGVNLSSLRPRRAYVKGVNGRSSGAVSWGGLYSYTTGLVEQGGSRRGALMLILEDWHPDIIEFINAKRESGKITNANISVGVSDALMTAIKYDADWELVFPDTTYEDYDEVWDGDVRKWALQGRRLITYQTIKARELWQMITESAWASAEPGIWFNDRSNLESNSWYYDSLTATNPCGEQPLPAWGVCNLGAINLAKFYDSEINGVNIHELGKVINAAVRFLDDVIDATPYFFAENAMQQVKERRIGLNTMGLAELLVRMGHRYGDEESLVFIDYLYKFIASTAYIASTHLAAERGSFPAYDKGQFMQSAYIKRLPLSVRRTIEKHGIRNVTLLTQAPNGTIGTMAGTSTGIEPFFNFTWMRKGRLGMHEEKMAVAQEWMDAHPGEPLPDYFVTAMDLTPEEHVRVQAVIQRWIDSAISKTCNLPSHYTVDQVSELYQLMHRLGVKGGTIYRDKSRDDQVLWNVEPEKEKCPDCGSENFEKVEGCSTCHDCGYSLCSI